MTTGERIRQLADERGISIHKLASLAGVSYNTLYSVVRRKSDRVDLTTVEKVANVFNIDIQELISESIKKPTLGEQLKSLRIHAELTPEQLAKGINATSAAINSYESDQQQPSREQLADIARVLGANPKQLEKLLLALPSTSQNEIDENWAIYWSYLVDYVHSELPHLTKLSKDNALDEWITDLSSPFANYRDGSEQLEIAKSLIKILVDLDLKWQRELLNDAKTYIDIQNKKSEKTRMLEQQEE